MRSSAPGSINVLFEVFWTLTENEFKVVSDPEVLIGFQLCGI
jgi:hypothetical protein